MRRLQRQPVAVLLLTMVPAASAYALEAGAWLEEIAIGVLAHDRGPTSDEHEDGIDANIEMWLRPPDSRYWQWIGSPRLHLGLTPNFNGATSALYAGGTYTFEISPHLFLEGALGLAVHNGTLHTSDRSACEEDSDCGFGSRVLFHYAVEVGVRFTDDTAVSLYYDHMSHQGTLDDENEGIDHVGLRYRIRY